MNIKKKIAIGLFSLLAYYGQSQNFELVENKGQWNPNVKFQGRLLNGAFFLQPQGYKVLQHDDKELQMITATLHGTANGSAMEAAAAKGDGKVPAPPENKPLVLHSHAYEVLFDQSNTNPEIIPEKQQVGYNNYFTGNDPKAWAGNCKIYAAATYKNVYPGIDVRYYSDNGHLKYDIIVHPKADLSKLALKYDGVDGLQIRNGDLYIKTSVGEIKEQFPYSYQLINGVRTQVNCKFKISGNTVKYQLGSFDNTKTLVIDPTLVFASFTGSQVDNWGYTATYGPGGTMFGGGIAFGAGYPVSNGAFQGTFGGGTNGGEGSGYDIAIIKLSANGSQRLYATFVGGSGNEAPHSMVTDAQGNLIVAGRTTSTNFPVRSPVRGVGGGWDIIIFKLNAAGSALTGSIRLGGASDDGVNIRNKYPSPSPSSLMQNYGDDSRSEVIFDASGNIVLASCTQSADFPITAGAFQATKAGPASGATDRQDGLFLKFDANLTNLIYGSFLGGSGDDAAYVLNSSPETGEIWIGGGTTSSNLPGNKTGTISGAINGSIDGFVAVVSAAGALIRSTYIGTAGNDQVYGLKFDIYGFPYIMGTTTGNFPVQNAPFSQPGGKQFIGKLQKDLSGYVYSTVFGNGSVNPNISPIAFLVDRCENVYISGWGGLLFDDPMLPRYATSGTAGLTVTPDAIQSSTDGSDFYFFVLEKNATRQLYGSFYGQNGPTTDHVDGGTSRFDDNGIIYQAICANCGRRVVFPVTPGAWATTNGSPGCNEALVKIEFNLAGIKGGVKSAIARVDNDTSGCVPVTIDFRDTVALAKQYEWDFGDGTGTFRSTTVNLSHTYNSIGTFRVRLIAIDSTKCFPRDTSFMNVRVREDVALLSGSGTKLPPCQSTVYRFTNTSTPFPGKTFTNTSFRWIWGDGSPDVISGTAQQDHTYPGVGTYNVKLVLEDTNFCNAPDTFPITIRISPNVRAAFTTPPSGCVPYNAVFTNTSLGGTDFAWDFGDGTTGTGSNPTHLYNTPGVYIVRLVATDITTCNLIDSTRFTVTVSSIPIAGFTYTPNPAEENTITTFTNTSVGATRFRWYYGDGDSLYTFRRDTVVRHQYNETRIYQPCIVAINQFNCPDTACLPLNSIVKPILDVPNVFTPNGDGVNDRAVVIGIGISRMVFRIYNRWGQLVFESTDRKLGWNGKFKGKDQPMDVYAYTLDAEFFDGVKTKKQGDVTLLR